VVARGRTERLRLAHRATTMFANARLERRALNCFARLGIHS
jgi:hypothetical protein